MPWPSGVPVNCGLLKRVKHTVYINVNLRIVFCDKWHESSHFKWITLFSSSHFTVNVMITLICVKSHFTRDTVYGAHNDINNSNNSSCVSSHP